MRKSYTLIEVLVVISILFFLATIVFFNMQSAREREDRMKALTFSSEFKSINASFLVSEWTFDGPTSENETATNMDVRDPWGDNHGEVIGANITIKDKEDCVLGKCLEFNQDQIEIEYNYNVEEVALEAWFYFNEYKNTNILGIPSAFIFCQENDQFSFKVGDESISFSVPLKEWTLLTLVYKNNTLTVYRNGKFLKEEQASTSISNIEKKFIIGNINGRIDNVRFYKFKKENE
jgi:Tfp pilus assembly major pilin PilA